jgi:phage shock protein B
MFWGDVLLIGLAVTGGLGILLILLVVLVVYAIARAGSGGRNRPLCEQEEHLLQEIHRGLRRMDARVDALETILLSEESKTTKGTTT